MHSFVFGIQASLLSLCLCLSSALWTRCGDQTDTHTELFPQVHMSYCQSEWKMPRFTLISIYTDDNWKGFVNAENYISNMVEVTVYEVEQLK